MLPGKLRDALCHHISVGSVCHLGPIGLKRQTLSVRHIFDIARDDFPVRLAFP